MAAGCVCVGRASVSSTLNDYTQERVKLTSLRSIKAETHTPRTYLAPQARFISEATQITSFLLPIAQVLDQKSTPAAVFYFLGRIEVAVKLIEMENYDTIWHFYSISHFFFF